MTEAEVAKVCNGVIMVPTTAGMTVLAYNLPGLKAAIKLPRDAYADIFAGRIKRWDDPRLLEANPGVTLPHLDIVRVARRDVSGGHDQPGLAQWGLWDRSIDPVAGRHDPCGRKRRRHRAAQD